jgi:hypothetical protein
LTVLELIRVGTRKKVLLLADGLALDAGDLGDNWHGALA